ncbi:MAG: hypothetical protein EOO11_11010 [Chitinophagaceae bacterium]|nr:MAG: hypothetical protein EOO11_11010 [Chitinophagaceae bacterium]
MIALQEKQALELLPALKRRWGGWIAPGLRSLLLSQTADWVQVELSFNDARGSDGHTRCFYLDFIGDDNGPLFRPQHDIVDNACTFVDLDGITLSQCFHDLFNPAAEAELDRIYQDWWLKEKGGEENVLMG